MQGALAPDRGQFASTMCLPLVPFRSVNEWVMKTISGRGTTADRPLLRESRVRRGPEGV